MHRNILATCAAVCLLTASTALARPNFGRGCSDCHGGGEPPVPAMQIIGFDGMADPDESATGATDRGMLKFFEVTPGGTVDLTVRIDFQDMQDVMYSIQLKRMETSGVVGGGTLVQSPDPSWFEQTGTDFPDPDRPYYTTTDFDGTPYTGPAEYTFTMTVDPSTDPDFYDLEFALAGQPGFFYMDEHFYLNVVPEPTTVLALGLAACAPLLRRRTRRQ
jgi:PEP-CTERM motif